MEDTSYVNLSLQKYNELYDKAKKFDELTKQFGDKLSDTIDTIIDNFNSLFTNNDEEETEQEELKAGDKVMIVGNIIQNDESDRPFEVRVNSGEVYWFRKEDVEKIKEEK